jgi:DNA repair exonuclease SbcCD ATPase subunit
MLSDKINRLPISRVDSPPINSFDEQNAVILINKQGNILSFEHSRRNSGAVTNRDRSENSTAQPSKPIAYGLKNDTVDVELERRRAELAALARAAEAKAKEAEEKCEQAEGRLEQELKERLLAEQRLRELEENRLRKLQAPVPIEAPQPRTASWAQPGTEARLKDAETRAKESQAWAKGAETELQSLRAKLAEVERKMAKTEAIAQALGDKARLLESQAEAAMAALTEANRKTAEAETTARIMEEKARAMESLLSEAESVGRQATEKYQTVEFELQAEAKQRAAAEQKLKEFEDELGSYLELDWSKDEPDMSRAVVVRQSVGTDEIAAQFHAQIETERRARREAEGARSTLEIRMREMEKALRIAEENNRQIAALNLAKSADDDQTYTVKKRKGFKYEFKFIGYGMAIALLLVALTVLIAMVSLQM